MDPTIAKYIGAGLAAIGTGAAHADAGDAGTDEFRSHRIHIDCSFSRLKLAAVSGRRGSHR